MRIEATRTEGNSGNMPTIDVLRALQGEVGTRRAGSEGERRTQEWLESRCAEMDLSVELDDFTFIGSEAYRPLFQIILLIWMTTSIWLSLTSQPFAGAAAFILLFLYLNVVHKKLDVRLARTKSRNILAGLSRPISGYVADPDKGPALLVCAHYDTPRSSPLWFLTIRELVRFLGPLAMLGIVLFVAFMLLHSFGWLAAIWGATGLRGYVTALGPWISRVIFVMVAPLAMIMIFTSLHSLISVKTDSPGADDNGSGTALVLEVARRMKENPPENVEVFFAWWGAEERGLFGSRQFVRRFHDQLNRDVLYLINTDCVGVGELLTIHTGQGIVRRHPTHGETVQRLECIAANLSIKTIRTWGSILSGGSSDHAEWVDRGYVHAISLLRGNYYAPSLPGRIFAALLRLPDANSIRLDHIHSSDDTLEGIKPPVLEQTTDVAEAYIREIDEKEQGLKSSSEAEKRPQALGQGH